LAGALTVSSGIDGLQRRMDRMDRLQGTVTVLRDDISVNFAATERSERIAHGASAAVRLMAEQLSGMRRQIRKLQTEVRALRGDG
jgi:hypothetical protein